MLFLISYHLIKPWLRRKEQESYLVKLKEMNMKENRLKTSKTNIKTNLNNFKFKA